MVQQHALARRAKRHAYETIFSPPPPLRDTNEAMLCQLGRWIARLTVPSLLGGDINVQPGRSEFLSLLHTHDLWRVNDDKPTTMTKQGQIGDNMPVDHLIINARALDLGVSVSPRYDICVSDHFPLVGDLSLTSLMHPRLWKWPALMKTDGNPKTSIPWSFAGTTYTEWADYATSWIAESYEAPRVSKLNPVSSHTLSVNPPQEQTFDRFRKVTRLQDELLNNPSEHVKRKTDRVLAQLKIIVDEDNALSDIKRAMTSYLQHTHDEAIKDWKAKVRGWGDHSV